MGTLGDAHKKLLVLSQPGGLREFVYPAMKGSTTEMGNDGSTKKIYWGAAALSELLVVKAENEAEEEGLQI